VTASPQPCSGRLQERLAGIASELAAVTGELDMMISTGRAPTPAAARMFEQEPDQLLLLLVQKTIRMRDVRARTLRHGLFADPAWDMLLDLAQARLLGRRICISSLCIASRVPATTALRWIKDMELHGEIIRRSDPSDKRRAYVEISEEAFEAVRATLLAPELPPVKAPL